MNWIADSYAKINLGLHVLERLPTGYHRIETGLLPIEWSDRFEISESDRYQLELTDSKIPAGDENLITKAYRAFEQYIGLHRHYRFTVQKQIPAGAGLGGGSSNAALVLRFLNKVEDVGLNQEDLSDLCRNLGSDIPFFLQSQPAIASGMGHDLHPVDIQTDCWIVTLYPGFESSTADAYRNCEPKPNPEFSIQSTLESEPVDEWRFLLENDLEHPVISRYEQIGHCKDQMYEFGALFAAMSGSGSSVFGFFEQDFVALQAYQAFLDLGMEVNMTRPGFSPDTGIYRAD